MGRRIHPRAKNYINVLYYRLLYISVVITLYTTWAHSCTINTKLEVLLINYHINWQFNIEKLPQIHASDVIRRKYNDKIRQKANSSVMLQFYSHLKPLDVAGSVFVHLPICITPCVSIIMSATIYKSRLFSYYLCAETTLFGTGRTRNGPY